MKEEKREIVYKSLDEIKPYERNARNNDNAVDSVANSVKQFNFNVPITVDKNGVIVSGHTRYKAAKKLGLERVPVIVLDDLTDDEIKAYRLADNKTGELANWDLVQLDEELESILNIDMEDYGFDLDEFDMEDEDYSISSDEDNHTTNTTKHVKMCGYDIEITDEEERKLKSFIVKYVDENGVTFGLVSELMSHVS